MLFFLNFLNNRSKCDRTPLVPGPKLLSINRTLRLRLLTLMLAFVLHFQPIYSGTSLPQSTPTSALKKDTESTISGIRFYEKNAALLDMPFQDIHNNTFTLRSWLQKHQKPIFLVFWATFCPPCMEEMPSLVKMATALRSQIDVLPIALDAIGQSGVLKSALKSFAIPLYHSPKLNEIMKNRGISGVPSFILLQADGQDIVTLSGSRDWASEENKKEILKHLAAKKKVASPFQKKAAHDKNPRKS